MASFRYFRLIAVEAIGRGSLELAEFQFGHADARVDGGATVTSRIPATTGTLSSLIDGNQATSVLWSANAVRSGGFSLTWDFGASTEVTQFRFAGTERERSLARLVIEVSVDGVTWAAMSTALYDQLGYFGSGVLSPWISEIDVVLSARTSLLLNSEGAAGGAVFTDSSRGRRTPSVIGTVVTSTAHSKFGPSSISFGGTGYLSYPPSADFAFRVGDFTVEAWVSFNTTAGSRILTNRVPQAGQSGSWSLTASPGNIGFSEVINGEPGVSANFDQLALGTFHHFAATRAGTVLRVFVNGYLLATNNTYGNDFFVETLPLVIGSSVNETILNGNLEDVRVLKGFAAYTSSFTPPATRLSADSVTVVRPTPSAKLFDVDTAFRVPNYEPIAGRVSGAEKRWRDVYFDGRGTIAGTVKEKGTSSDTPVRKRVRLFRDRDGLFVRETFSNPITGAYAFTGIDETVSYSVVSYDNNANFRAVIADRVIPIIP